jgi:aminopeptidase N
MLLRRLLPLFLTVLALALPAAAQFPEAPVGPDGYRPGVDVQRYAFDLTLTDASDRIEGVATIDVRFTSDTLTVLPLDLVATTGGTGMTVSAVTEEGRATTFRHRDQRLEVILSAPPAAGEQRTFTVIYAGVPEDGLIIGENRHGRRTFFGDNWPNRARHWLPTVDHPSDKAFFEWTVTLPATYNVVANGRLRENSDLGDGRRRVRYVTEAPLATKIAVIGAADFAVEVAEVVDGIPVESWVYPEDREAGFYDFARAVRALQVFTSLLGEYPFEKLANVQSTTRYGGMENASAIFYDEASVTGTRVNEALIAHEVAHQWFGNAVTETDWPHLWLSEGFATYLTHVYFELTYGEDVRAQRMAADRRIVAAFAAANPDRPVVDTTYATPTDLLNANSYHKGGWVLHMLRRQVGDEAFFEGLRTFYTQYRGGNADTDAFRKVMETVSGRNLGAFFEQWLIRPGVPRVSGSWRHADGRLTVTLHQTQPGAPFTFPLEVSVVATSGAQIEVLQFGGAETTLMLELPERPTEVILDPRVHALMALEAFGEG